MNATRLSPTRYIASAVLIAGGAVALLGMRRPADRSVPTLRIVAVDYGYQLPKEIPAGPTRLELVNQGRELHHAQLIRLEHGKTLADLAKLQPGSPPPSWVVPVGGPGAVDPSVRVEGRGRAMAIVGNACPLAELVRESPEVCRAMEALVAEVTGLPAREECDRGEHPRCMFVVG